MDLDLLKPMKITAFIIAILFIVVGYKGISVALKEYLQVWITTSGKVIEYSFEPNSPGFDQSFRRLNILYEYTVDGTVFQSRSVRADPSQIAFHPMSWPWLDSISRQAPSLSNIYNPSHRSVEFITWKPLQPTWLVWWRC